MTKILPVSNKIKIGIKKMSSKKQNISLKPIKNYSQYIQEYGLKP